MKHQITKRIVSLALILALLAGFAVPTQATGNEMREISFTQVDNSVVADHLADREVVTAEEEKPDPNAEVRVSIVLKDESTIGAGFSTVGIAQNAEAMAYRAALKENQAAVTTAIEQALGCELDVVRNLTLAGNIISANVTYSQLDTIAQVEGVKTLYLEQQYAPAVVEKEETLKPNMATSGRQIGSSVAWAAGYTGLGSRIAIIDTGTDVNHQSFSAAAFEYSLAYAAGEANMGIDEYKAHIGLLTAAEIAGVLDELNAQVDPNKAYVNTKIPYGFNYVDVDYDITHMNDYQGEHGSHVSGIAAANRYIKAEGGFVDALSSVAVQGVAPDAQVLTMKVFGKNGGAWDSDYMAAIEDAIVLGCDSVNLSLGSAQPGFSWEPYTDYPYQDILDDLAKCDTLVVTSASNSFAWAQGSMLGAQYVEDPNFHTAGSPGTYTNTLAVASSNNDGMSSPIFRVGGETIMYIDGVFTSNNMNSIPGQYEYVFLDTYGEAQEWEAVDGGLAGKVAIFAAGGNGMFSEFADNAARLDCVAVIIYNVSDNPLYMDMSYFHYTIPAVSITKSDSDLIRSLSTPVTDEAGNVKYYTGTIDIPAIGAESIYYDSEFITMSDFSSWGVPGSLELKPEITAPGGDIYSVFGETPNYGGSTA